MSVNLVAAEHWPEQQALHRLLQLYQYDFSEIETVPVGSDGVFHQLDDARWDMGYLITVDSQLAGFALISRQASRIEPGATVWWMNEFFVMRGFRRTGVGRTAAHDILRRHPGGWEITQTPNNTAATTFWRAVLRPYDARECEYDEVDGTRRPLFAFNGTAGHESL
jgi:predicted acetyltransferase